MLLPKSPTAPAPLPPRPIPSCCRRRFLLAACSALLGVAVSAPAVRSAESAKPQDRDESIRKLTERLEIGPGAAIADVGAGKGVHTWTFADVVGADGKVYATEIGENMVKSLRAEAERQELPQVQAVLGREDDPNLPAASVDLVFLKFVYHHFGKPREMLRGIRQALKPGGYLVVVDRHPGTLQDWIPRAERTQKHAWLAETTVVREAREEGLEYVGTAEELWYEKEPFVLIFRRPQQPATAAGDPDPLQPLRTSDLTAVFPTLQPFRRSAVIALGEARQLIKPIIERAKDGAVEIVLEEWATQKDERPELPAGVELPSVLTEKGDPQLTDEPLDAVFFLDTYHLLFHAPVLLGKLHERLVPGGRVYILDRQAAEPLSRREASHRRQIAAEMVREELTAAGFELCGEGKPPAPDRLVLVFRKPE